MSDLPEPMTPADCDLRGYDFMPVFGHRLFGSAFYARATDAEFRAAMRLWWAAWQQCPAGSLPEDDAALALLADYGRDLKGFAKVRAVALHGFIECSDGRLYHPLLCAEARGAYERRRKERERKATFRARDRQSQTPPSGGDIPPVSHTESASCPAGQDEGRDAESVGTGQNRTEQDRTERKEEKKEVASQPLAARPPRGSRLPLEWRPEPDEAGFAHSLGLDPDSVAAQFRDYWHAKPGKDAVKLDWSATWRGWCRRDAERKPTNPNRSTEKPRPWWLEDMIHERH